MAGLFEVAKAVQGKSDVKINEAQAKQLVDGVFTSIKEMCENGDKITIRGFGTFQLKTTPAHTARNPLTGKPVDVPEKSKVIFKAAVPAP